MVGVAVLSSWVGTGLQKASGARNLPFAPNLRMSLFISGEISLISKITLKMTKIEGEIPTIGSKKVKKGGFVGDNRNFSAYLDQK